MTQTIARRRPGTYSRGEDTRRRILETALDIFAAEGYEGASTRRLAERAGVNLPAIQYYFGSKEGLYRAVIGDIVEHTETHLAPLAPKVGAAIADPGARPEDLLELLCAMLESFVALVTGGTQIESRRLLFARAEVERTPGLDFLHESGMRQIFQPCLGLVSRLLGKSPEDPEMAFRTLSLIGQVAIFCNNGVRHVLKSPVLGEESVCDIQALVRANTQAIIRAALSEAKAV
jgi:AcrR family transcriptional regulator